MALDNYFASPEVYFREPKAVVDKKKLDATYARYRGNYSGVPNAGLFGVQMFQTCLSNGLDLEGHSNTGSWII